jgi:hypothetical protein
LAAEKNKQKQNKRQAQEKKNEEEPVILQRIELKLQGFISFFYKKKKQKKQKTKKVIFFSRFPGSQARYTERSRKQGKPTWREGK